ncbi:MAG: NfeD family protein [Beijerinckiaceae bacterium]|nr:NfeD family protein [Beijerinckiaceae bacterium]MCI0736511.1 NfeD family protein [Beijerinckiaceae bacterium]
MDAIIDNPAALFLIAGLVLLGIDIFVIGLSPLMFVASGALVTSGLLYLAGWKSGLLYFTGWNPGLLEALAICAAVSLLIAIVGRRPLQAFQNSNIQEDSSSDLIGRELVTTQDITKTDGWVYWSGTQWQARLADSVDVERVGPGIRMQVVEVRNLALILVPVC